MHFKVNTSKFQCNLQCTNLLAELVKTASQNDSFSSLHKNITDHAVKVLSIGVERCVISLHEGSIVLVPLLQMLLLFLLQKLDRVKGHVMQRVVKI